MHHHASTSLRCSVGQRTCFAIVSWPALFAFVKHTPAETSHRRLMTWPDNSLEQLYIRFADIPPTDLDNCTIASPIIDIEAQIFMRPQRHIVV